MWESVCVVRVSMGRSACVLRLCPSSWTLFTLYGRPLSLREVGEE